ncbi:MAG: ABC transporter permease [Clostridiales bacterium]|jgi:peptide/nickel transport system permease protein|nr:ABC transporter permease [Clostridiales bacterium]
MKYLLKRLLMMLPMLVGISLVSYVIMNMAPGDAASMYVNPEELRNQVSIDAVREKLQLDSPVLVRYAAWLGQVLQGNLGYSYISRQPVASEIAARLVPTIQLSVAALALELVVGVSLGIFCAKRQYRASDNILSLLSFVGMSMPSFWFGMLLILFFTLRVGWLPSMGLVTVGLKGPWHVLLADRARHMAMPVIALSFAGVGSWLRFQRASFLDVMGQDYIRTARSKGLKEGAVTWRHAFRNSCIPVVTMLGGSLPGLIGGSFVIENMFGIPGLGRYGTMAVLARDYPAVMAVTLFSSILVMAGVLLSDLLYVLVDPRIKYS